MSTRPDYINRDILDNLKTYDADIIELGVQSFDPDVLRASNRGHTIEDVYKACHLIKEYGFTLGIQLMIGLPGDSPAKSVASAKEAVRLSPQLARLYPTIVLRDTRLLQMYEEGIYQPLTTEEAVSTTKEMYRILDDAGITILRVGLKSTDLITEGEAICGHTFHPAFRQLVEGELAKESLENQLHQLLENAGETKAPAGYFAFKSNGHSFSNMIGNAKRNKLYFAEKYPGIKIRWQLDTALEDGQYSVIKY